MNVYVFLNQLLGPNIARVSSDLGCSFFGQTQLGGVCSYIIYIRNISERRDLARIMLSKNTGKGGRYRVVMFYVSFLSS